MGLFSTGPPYLCTPDSKQHCTLLLIVPNGNLGKRFECRSFMWEVIPGNLRREVKGWGKVARAGCAFQPLLLVAATLSCWGTRQGWGGWGGVILQLPAVLAQLLPWHSGRGRRCLQWHCPQGVLAVSAGMWGRAVFTSAPYSLSASSSRHLSPTRAARWWKSCSSYPGI